MRSTLRRLLPPFLAVALALIPVVGVHAASTAEEGIHVVQPGDTLFGIAMQHGVTIDSLVQSNRLVNPNAIYVGQKLRITADADDEGARPANAPSEDESEAHIVQPGETLSAIAAAHGVTVEAIAEASGIAASDLLRVGQRLRIPRRASPPPPAELEPAAPEPEEASEAEPAPSVYVVRPGDTLSEIARRFQVPVASLARANNLSNHGLLFPGRKLAIPQPREVRPRGGDKRVVVSISQQRCYVYDGDTLLYEWVCSTGRRSSPTKPGTYYIQSKIRTAYGSAWDIWMPYWLGIYWAGSTENGFHGLPWNATTGRPTWAGLVGTPITYGCIMLSNENAKILWEMAYIGMPIIIEY